jgi:hypothetical protein
MSSRFAGRGKSKMHPAAEFTIASAFPGWLPDLIREEAAKVVRRHLEAGSDPAAVIRLAVDRRMKPVWSELRKNNRGGDDRNYYGIPAERRDLAMLALFRDALICYQSAPAAISRRELQDERKFCREHAAALVKEIEELKRRGIEAAGSAACKYAPVLPGLATAAEFYRVRSETLEGFQVERHRTDPRLEGFLTSLLWCTRSSFQLPPAAAERINRRNAALFGIIATIASVLFEVDVSKDTVRNAEVS